MKMPQGLTTPHRASGARTPPHGGGEKPDTGWRLFFRTVVARAYPRVIGYTREKVWVFFEMFLPFLATTGYVFVYRAMNAPPDYIGFVVIGGAMTSFWINVIWSMAAQLYWEKDSGNLALYIMAPNSMIAILLGMALGGMSISAMRAGVIFILGTVLFHVSFAVSNAPLLVAVFVVCLTALYGLGMLFASLFLLWGRNVWQVMTMFQEPIYFLSGFYFPVRSFGFVIAMAASIIPLTLGLDAMRQLLFAAGAKAGFLPAGLELAVLAVLSVVFITAAKYALNHIERLAVQHGTLTDRRR